MPFAGSDREAQSAETKRWLEPMMQLAVPSTHHSSTTTTKTRGLKLGVTQIRG
jgi:hypothetical protein